MPTVRLIVTVGIAWILSLALAIFVLASIHRALSSPLRGGRPVRNVTCGR